MQSYNIYRGQVYLKRKRRKQRIIIIVLSVFVLAILGYVGYTVFVPHYEKADGVVITKTTDTTLSVKWHAPEKSDAYYVYWKTGNKDFKKSPKVKTASYTIKNLKQATKYTVCVTACYDTAESGMSGEQFAYTAAEKPVITEGVSEEQGQIKIAWKKNPKALLYKVQYKESIDSGYDKKNTINVKKSEGCQAVINDLTERATYDIRVCAVTMGVGTQTTGMWSKTTLSVRRKQRELDPNKPMVALSFDDGPGYGKSGDRILDILEKYDVKATFFMLGTGVQSHPENVKRKAQLGMELGNHTYDHTHYGESVTASDIKKASEAIKKVTGQYPTAFRSPGGMTTDAIKKECKKENMSLYHWNVDTEDWKTQNASSIYYRAVNSISDGDIVLMHEIYDATADALEKIIPKLIKKGFQIVSCSELIEYKTGEAPKAGTEYFSAYES